MSKSAAPIGPLRYMALTLVIAAGYYGFTELGKSLLLKDGVGAFWPSAGLGIAILYLGGLRWWPAVLLGDMGSIATDMVNLGVPTGTALGEAAGDLGRTLVSVFVLRRLAGPRAALDRLPQVGAVLASCVSGAVVSATVALLAFAAADQVGESSWLFWRSWWLGDVSGGLVILSLALAWSRPVAQTVRERAVPEGLLVLAAVITLSIAGATSHQPLDYVVFPALIWAAVRLEIQGATLALTVAVTIAVWITSDQLGPFVAHSTNGTALDVQLYITIASVTVLCLAAAITERRRAQVALTESRARIVAAGAAERRRIERDLHDGAQQQLVALRVTLRLAEDLIEDDPGSARQKIGALGPFIDEILDEIRSLAAGIYPSTLANLGLGESLRALARQSPVPAHVQFDGPERCSPEVEEAVYFCCSEALQNVVKHARGVTGASISVRHGKGLRFEVRDDGDGFSLDHVDRGEGLRNMHERIEAVGGELNIVSSPAEGTAVRGTIPLDPPRHQP